MNVSSAANAAASHLQVNARQTTPATAAVGDSKSTASHGAVPKGAAAGTTVTISSAAKAAMAEAAETPAQTAKEAQGNDLQAKRLMAKEAAAKAAQ